MVIQGPDLALDVVKIIKPFNLFLFILPDAVIPWHFQRSLFPIPSNFSKILTEGSKLMASNYGANSKRRCRFFSTLARVEA